MSAVGAFGVEGVESVTFAELRLWGFRGCPQKLGTLEVCHVSEASDHLFSSKELANRSSMVTEQPPEHRRQP